jgi:hypothetical protein
MSNLTTTAARLRIAPRAATLVLVGDPTLDRLYAAEWAVAAPQIEEREGEIDVRYTIGDRMKALGPRNASLTLRLNPAARWTLDIDGGVSGLRADLRDLGVASIAIAGGATDVELDLPAPRGELAVTIAGGVSRAAIRRPAAIPVGVEIAGGASRLRLDEEAIGAVGGHVRLVTPAGAHGDDRVALAIRGGASRLTIGPHT